MRTSSSQGRSAPFFDWLTEQKNRKDAIGVLAAAAVTDKTFPRYAKRLHILLYYYDNNPPSRRTIKLAHAEWRSHKKAMA